MNINLIKNNYIKIFLIIILSLIIDNFYIFHITNPPAWDQGYHLSNVFKMFNIIDNSKINISNKIDDLLNITNSYRGPITYLISALFLKIFKNSYHISYLSNQIFSIISIISIFNLGKLFKNESIGIWGAIIFTFSSLIINQRSDYLIDLSLTSFSTLNLLFFTKWYLDESKSYKYSILSGLSLALVFLTKPTGIILFLLPLLFILVRKFKNQKSLSKNIKELFLFLFCFTIIIFPWFSRHWITIISSIINAWKWGINYQDGFNTNSIDSWVYYFKKLPLMFGIINFSILTTVFILEKFYKNFSLKIRINNFKKINLWFFLYIFNCYLIVSLMSTKDVRFILPIYPLLCLYLSIFINSKKSNILSIKYKKIILVLSLCISLLFNNEINYINSKNNPQYVWPHKEIIKEIQNKTLNLTSTLAVLPDTKEINTFNLEAEASRQGEYVSVRQVVSNKNTYKDDLKYFDWFLVKTGSQGIMTNEAKDLLNIYLLNNSSFFIEKKWILPDESEIILLRRKSINSNLLIKKSIYNRNSIDIKQIKNGINISFTEKGKLIKSSNLLIDFYGEEFQKSANVSLANGFFHDSFNENKFYTLSQDVEFDFPKDISKSLIIKARLINKDGELTPLYIFNNRLDIDEKKIDSDYIQMANRISKVELLGSYLRNGEYKNLFDLVGIINQSDPKQIYLKNSEIIFTQRYKENKNLKDLYSILISQILQRKVSEAEKTINLILESDQENGNTYLAKSILNIYLLDKKEARSAIVKTKVLEKSLEVNKVLNIIDGLTYLLEIQFINAYKSFAL